MTLQQSIDVPQCNANIKDALDIINAYIAN